MGIDEPDALGVPGEEGLDGPGRAGAVRALEVGELDDGHGRVGGPARGERPGSLGERRPPLGGLAGGGLVLLRQRRGDLRGRTADVDGVGGEEEQARPVLGDEERVGLAVDGERPTVEARDVAVLELSHLDRRLAKGGDLQPEVRDDPRAEVRVVGRGLPVGRAAGHEGEREEGEEAEHGRRRCAGGG